MKEIIKEDNSNLEVNDSQTLRSKIIDGALEQKTRDIETKLFHEKIIKTKFDDIITQYGKEK